MTAAVAPVTPDELRRIDLFDGLEDAQLAQWATAATVRRVAVDEVIAEQGEAADGLQLLLEGSAEGYVIEGDRLEPVGRQEAPTWLGAIAVLTEGPMGVRMIAVTECRLATVPTDAFYDLAVAHRPVLRRILRQIRPVFARITSMEANRERLASLGTMAAGLAHELNNPAAATRRAAADLADAFQVASATLGSFVEAGLSREEAERLVLRQREALERAGERGPLGALDAADAEDEVLDALEAAGIAEPWRLVEPLAAAGLDAAWVAEVAEEGGAAADAALRWIAASLAARGLIEELTDSAARMSSLVGAVKSYAYMDRGDVVDVDLHEGLETTLTLLGHKLKHTRIEVVRDYDRDLPRMTVHGPELNQVWTNLLDNAIDALGEAGTLTVRTRRDGDCALVEIADSGPGIPDDVVPRIFDPFFTTKDVGSGTGLGLDTARRIVADRHRGSLTLDTSPAGTTFHVSLPIPGG